MAWTERGLAAAGIGLVAAVLAGLSLHVPGELGIGSDQRLAVFVALAVGAGLFYGPAVFLVLRRPMGARAIWIILGFAAVMRLLVVFSPAFLSSDLYRYVWDGMVQHAGINPYLFIPADPALSFLRDSAIFPHINRADYAPTIYPPVAQTIFLAVAAISPTVTAMKLAMTVFDGVAIFAIMQLLSAAGLPRARVLIYAWHPLPIWEFAGSAHIDVIAIAFITLAMLAQTRARTALAGTLLAGAVLVKFLPAVLLPAIWRRWDWTFAAIFTAVIAAAYLPYLGAGWHVLGFLSGYASEEGLSTGGGLYPVFALGSLVALPAYAGKLYLGLLALVLLGLALRMVFSNRDQADPRVMAVRVVVLTTIVTVGLSPHYPWYFCWLLPASCLVPCFSVLTLSFASFLIYLNPIHSELLWPTIVYVPFALLAVLELLRRRPLQVFGRS